MNRRSRVPVGIRLAAKTERRGECLIWTGAVSDSGYGVIGTTVGDRHTITGVHRVAYAEHHGAIPDGMHIDHLCMVRTCVEPNHLEAVTQAENNIRAGRARRARKVAA